MVVRVAISHGAEGSAFADAMAKDIRRENPVGVAPVVNPDQYMPSTDLGKQAFQTLSAMYSNKAGPPR